MNDTSNPNAYDANKRASPPPKKPRFFLLLEELIGRKVRIPRILLHAANGTVQPLAIGSREAFNQFAARHDYDADATAALNAVVASLVRAPSYHTALAADGAMRFDIDVNPVGPVSETDRMSAQIALLAISISKASEHLGKMISKLDNIMNQIDSAPLPARKEARTIVQNAISKANDITGTIDQSRTIAKRSPAAAPAMSAEEVMRARMQSRSPR